MADIDQFYPTIYTHAVPWALHTKAVCKAALKIPKAKKAPPLLGAVLDKFLRCMNDGQTHGIPIGPDTSFVVSEILLAAADAALLAKRGSTFSGFRSFDDYELCFQSLSAAEDTLADLQIILASLELSLNSNKTRILTLPYGLEDSWSVELRSRTIRPQTAPVGQRNDILSFFSRAFDFAQAHPSHSVLRYAVAHLQRLHVASDAWRTFCNCVLGAASADPSTLQIALGTLHQVAGLGGHTVPKGPLREVFESIIARHAVRAHGSEVAWALWGSLAWSVPLSTATARLISGMDDDFVALLALHANSRHLFPKGALHTANWSNIVAQPDALLGEHWLLAYEANQQGWLSAPAVAASTEFSAMSANGVHFYDHTKAKPQFPAAGRALPGGTLWTGYI